MALRVDSMPIDASGLQPSSPSPMPQGTSHDKPPAHWLALFGDNVPVFETGADATAHAGGDIAAPAVTRADRGVELSTSQNADGWITPRISRMDPRQPPAPGPVDAISAARISDTGWLTVKQPAKSASVAVNVVPIAAAKTTKLSRLAARFTSRAQNRPPADAIAASTPDPAGSVPIRAPIARPPIAWPQDAQPPIAQSPGDPWAKVGLAGAVHADVGHLQAGDGTGAATSGGQTSYLAPTVPSRTDVSRTNVSTVAARVSARSGSPIATTRAVQLAGGPGSSTLPTLASEQRIELPAAAAGTEMTIQPIRHPSASAYRAEAAAPWPELPEPPQIPDFPDAVDDQRHRDRLRRERLEL